MFSENLQKEAIRHLNSLAGVCDNASTQDGQGFSKSDLIGHYIVEMPDEAMDKDWFIIAFQLVIKYQKQLNIDVNSFKYALSDLSDKKLSEVKSSRKDKVKRRIRMTDDGDFEIYFPNKQSMKGFYRDIVKTEEWIREKSIPHGYCFIVKRGAKEFVERIINKFPNWFISTDAEYALLNEDKTKPIDVSSAIEYQLYITGNSLQDKITFTFKFNRDIMETIRAFSERKFHDHPARWEARVTEEYEIKFLKGLIKDYDCKVSKDLELQLSNLKDDEVDSLLQSTKEKAEKIKELNRPRSLVTYNNGKFQIRFTKFSDDFLSYIKNNFIEKEFKGGIDPFWEISINPKNIAPLKEIMSDKYWEFDLNSTNYIEENYQKAEDEIKFNELARSISLALSSSETCSDDFNPDLSKINGTLLPFQFVVAEYATLRKNVLIGDDMGLGKSLSALACAALLKLDSNVIIGCPAIARLTWLEEIRKWIPDAMVYIAKKANSKKMAKKEKEEIMKANFVICSYNKIKFYEDILMEKNSLLFIGDESQYLKTKTSQRYIACHKISNTCDRVYLLSGTPLTNRPKDLITQLDMLKVLDSDFGGERKFLFTYCGAVNNGYGYNFNGSSNLSELRTKLRESCMVRRKKDDVMKDLPKKRRMRIPVEISNRKKYDDCNDSFMYAIVQSLKVEATKAAVRESIAKKDRSSYIKNYIKDGVASAIKGKVFSHTNVLRRITGEGLIKPSLEWIKGFCETGKQLVVFCYHQDQQNAIYNDLKGNKKISVGKIFSTGSDEEKKAAEKSFQQGDVQVLVCSQMGANTNITLTAATTVFTAEYTYVPGDHLQAEDRCRRIGTSEDADSIDCYYMHASETVDDYFWDILSEKFTIIENTLDTDDSEDFENVESSVKNELFNAMFSDLMKSDYLKEI